MFFAFIFHHFVVSQSIVIQHGWTRSLGCVGPPDQISIFNTSKLTGFPVAASFISSNALSTTKYCGLDPVPRRIGCCVRVLDTTISSSVASLSVSRPMVSSDVALSQLNVWTPSSSNGMSYCFLNWTSTAGDVNVLMLLQDGSCQNGFVTW